ncbi:hypothetical protein HPB50_014408 [Hyalomma asiaticum]|uniref:Uncharacterized protein n=1 Tax=Hyalomma asiaticum TaxID=266040 RepID=A0ACB7TMT0_HYAAI|nr:hypothetical protein HPB50_014408 [Hyalomma asiaticum]
MGVGSSVGHGRSGAAGAEGRGGSCSSPGSRDRSSANTPTPLLSGAKHPLSEAVRRPAEVVDAKEDFARARCRRDGRVKPAFLGRWHNPAVPSSPRRLRDIDLTHPFDVRVLGEAQERPKQIIVCPVRTFMRSPSAVAKTAQAAGAGTRASSRPGRISQEVIQRCLHNRMEKGHASGGSSTLRLCGSHDRGQGGVREDPPERSLSSASEAA